ncbi:hypothetical protein VOLCADRAFT_105376 [Volvox carteri f. nagariensis]|uniref:Uncharacterized protein n=1 Tax=Volvox carteri f. nagariensis TaxID=3068 RepID=D8U0X6_VOLCA|nr:uncharacterized protein VOLCADRAFT_105376 [Volvox carteri f. nagariensis]EFJ46626.1 hypothetical protein VOLCADRAFT_105376 [Volvox carteri f. nagariensis]|eukprot:XP_002952155.1 hypothetical protein VOLCADRAFT_105376 [Volvox carteri f. nagariensis]
MSAPQQTGSMQAATLRCPPNVFRERYSLADFEVTHTYVEGPNWSVCAARCKWSDAPVVLQTYAEVGNLSGCMSLALAAAHGLTNHPALLPLYAVFRDAGNPPSAGGGGLTDSKGSSNSRPNTVGDGGGNGGSSAGGGVGCGDRIIMVYPGGPAQHPLYVGWPPTSPGSSPPLGSYGGGSGSGPPVSERGVVRGLLQPLSELVGVLGSMGLRPPYVCGLDVWMDSPEAPVPGQALFMGWYVSWVGVMKAQGIRKGRPPGELLPAAMPFAAPYLRANPIAAGDQTERNGDMFKRWLSWSAAALVHTVLIGSPPPEGSAPRKARRQMPPEGAAAGGGGGVAGVPQLPPLTTSNSGVPRGSVLMSFGGQRQSLMGSQGGPHHGGVSVSGCTNGEVGSGGSRVRIRSPQRTHRALDPMPLWLSDEAGDWFRRGLAPECSMRVPFDEQMKHAWVGRHALPRSFTANGNVVRRESLGCMPRELHPLMLDVVPMGLTRPGKEEVDNLMTEMAMTEPPSVAKPAMPWQVVEGPQGPGPDFSAGGGVVVVEGFTPMVSDVDPARDTSVVERYEVAEEQRDDGTRVVEELRVVSGKTDGAFSRAAKALQAAMARRAEAGQWVMANPRGSTFDDIARQNQMRAQVTQPQQAPAAKRRESSTGGPAPQVQSARSRNIEAVPVAASVVRNASPLPLPAASAPAGRNRSPGPKGAKGPAKNSKAAKY